MATVNISAKYNKIRLALLGKKTKPRTFFYVVVAAVLYFVRAHVYILKPQLYAEDGYTWISDAYNKGIKSLTLPLNGFLHLPERLFGWLYVSLVPLQFAPAVFNLTGFLIFCVMVYYLFSPRTNILSNNYQRLYVLLSLCLLANAHEFFFNFSNSIFLLGIIGALILIATRPRNKFVRISEKILFTLACFTLPFCWIYLPIALVERIKFRGKNLYFLCLALAGSVTQLIVRLTSHAARSSVGITDIFSKHSALVIYNQIIIPAIRFARLDLASDNGSLQHNEFLLTFVFGLTLCALLYVLYESNRQVRYLLFFFIAMTIASLISPLVGGSSSGVVVLKVLATVTGGNRYFIFGVLGLFVVLDKISEAAFKHQTRYVFLAIFMGFGLYTSIHTGNFFINKNLVDYRAQYNTDISAIEKNDKQSETIPENPVPFYIQLNAK